MPPLALETGLHPGDLWPLGLLFAGVAIFAAVGALSHEHDRAFSASLIYLGLGVAAAVVINVFDVGWLEFTEDSRVVERICELAMVVPCSRPGSSSTAR